MVELADQLHRTGQGVEAAIPVVADIHHAAADRAIPFQDVESAASVPLEAVAV